MCDFSARVGNDPEANDVPLLSDKPPARPLLDGFGLDQFFIVAVEIFAEPFWRKSNRQLRNFTHGEYLFGMAKRCDQEATAAPVA